MLSLSLTFLPLSAMMKSCALRALLIEKQSNIAVSIASKNELSNRREAHSLGWGRVVDVEPLRCLVTFKAQERPHAVVGADDGKKNVGENTVACFVASSRGENGSLSRRLLAANEAHIPWKILLLDQFLGSAYDVHEVDCRSAG